MIMEYVIHREKFHILKNRYRAGSMLRVVLCNVNWQFDKFEFSKTRKKEKNKLSCCQLVKRKIFSISVQTSLNKSNKQSITKSTFFFQKKVIFFILSKNKKTRVDEIVSFLFFRVTFELHNKLKIRSIFWQRV